MTISPAILRPANQHAECQGLLPGLLERRHVQRKAVRDPGWELTTAPCVYNKDLLKRAGLVDEKGEAKPPKDWDELREYAKKLTEFDSNGRMKVLGFAPLYGNSWLYMYSWMNGGEFMEPDGRKCIMNDPKNVEALQYIVDLYDDAGGYDKVSAFQAGFQNDALDPFVQGKVAMKIDGSWIVAWNLAHLWTRFELWCGPAAAAEERDRQGAQDGLVVRRIRLRNSHDRQTQGCGMGIHQVHHEHQGVGE